ncbi:MAG TPA: tetratricopeptide repeat protein [Gemmataceae bacterium]|nr:tetratricopeptide repeat protein [Gemmataceae bacterium]
MPSTAGTLAKALKHHQAGSLCEARRLYWRILADDPRNADALHLLGVASHQTGRNDEAAGAIRKAIALDSQRAEFHNDLGEVLRAQDLFPEAQACFEQALRLHPNYAEAHNNLGLVLKTLGQVNSALRCFLKAMQLRPNFAEPYNHAAILAFNQHELEQAVVFFQKAIRLNPSYGVAISNLGIVYLAQNKYPEAADCFQESIRLDPRYAAAHNNLGIIYQILGQFDQAQACFHEAVRLDPKAAEAHNNIGNVLWSLERLPEALQCYQEALRLNADHAEARANLCKLLKEQGRHAEAVVSFEQALGQAPTDALKLLSALMLPIIPESLDEVHRHRRRIEENLNRLREEKLVIEDPVRQLSNLLFYLSYQGMNDRAIMAETADILARATPSLSWTAPHCAGALRGLTPPTQEAERRIRIGFISRSFYNHTIGKLNAGIIRNLARDRFHITLFTFPRADDEWRRFIREGADATVVLPFQLEQARRQIADERLDVLFYTDIGMDAWTYFLAFARLAPVQCITWGHPVTTGIPTIDYFLSARDLEPPDAGEHYSERLVQLENLPTYYHRLRLPDHFRARSYFGLAQDDHLYLCPQSLFKLHPELDRLFDGILRADPLGRIVLIAGHQDYWIELLMKRLRGVLGERTDRVVVLPRQSPEDFLSLLALADAVLDPIHFGGGNTAYEAFAVGSPIVTLPGRFMRGRVTYACYQRMGVLDCVAADAEDYVRIAVRLGSDPAWRADVRARILAAKDVLFENRGLIDELEQFFLTAVHQASAAGGDVIASQESSADFDNKERTKSVGERGR